MKQGQRKRKKKPAGNPKPTEPALASISHALAGGSSGKQAAEALRAYLECSSSCGITGSELGTTSSSDSASWLIGLAGIGNPFRGNNKAKRLVAATGTVSTVLGMDYLKPSPKKEAFRPNVWFPNRILVNDSEEAEQFLMNMLGEDCELSLAVVRDVLCQCGYNVEKALDVLLDMSGSSDECSTSTKSLIDYASSREDARFVVSSDENIADRESESTSNSCESEFQDSIWFAGNSYKNYSEALVGSETQSSTCSKPVGSNASQEVLESFYKIYKSPQHEPRTMNWRDIAKKMSSFSNGVDVCHSIEEPPKGEEYVLCRKEARQHWDSMKSTYLKAATAYSKGEKSYAAYLSDQGKKYSRMGQEADERASHEIFRARNKNIENVITIDLHGQHVKQAMRLLKFHLLLPSIQKLRVITGCGSHGAGKSKLKQMVIKLAQNEGIKCVEENRGTVVLKLEGPRDFSFLDCESDSD